MRITATAIYENGTLRLLTPVDLPQQARVQVEIRPSKESVAAESLETTPEQIARALALLSEAGLIVEQKEQQRQPQHVSEERRQELAQLYSQGDPLSEVIIRDRGARVLLAEP